MTSAELATMSGNRCILQLRGLPPFYSPKGTLTVWWDIVPNSDQCEIYTYMAGGGCTLPVLAMVLMPSEGYEGVTKFVLDRMTTYGLNACPPLLVGVGVATSVETAALLSKKTLMRDIGSHSENERAAKMEKLLEDGINTIGLDPQGMGGKHGSSQATKIPASSSSPSAVPRQQGTDGLTSV